MGRERWSRSEVILLAVSLTALAIAVIYRLSADPFGGAADRATIESAGLIDDVDATEAIAAAGRKRSARQQVSSMSTRRSTSSIAESTTTASSALRRPSTTEGVSTTTTIQSTTTTPHSTTTTVESTTTTAQSTSTSEERAASTTSTPITAPGPAGPAAADDAITGEAGKDLKVAVMENDGEGAAPLDKDTLVIVSGPGHAESHRVHGDHIHYRSFDDFSGEDRLRYRICDEDGSCDEATVVMTIEP